MESKHNKFDQSIHRLSEDGKSWILKETPSGMFESHNLTKERESYNELVDRVSTINPDLSPQQAMEKIAEAERTFDYRFFGITYGNTIVRRRNQLAAYNAINVISPEDRLELANVQQEFDKTTTEIIKQTGDSQEQVKKSVDSLLDVGIATNFHEARNILIEGPVIKGFEETQDQKLSNKDVGDFLKETFGEKTLRLAKVGMVIKDDMYVMNPGQGDERMKLGNTLIDRKLVSWSSGMLLANTKEDYIQAEMALEGVTDPLQLKHTYKLRATSGSISGFDRINLRSFSLEKSTDYDYLASIDVTTEEDRMRAYILGTIAHEIAHRYEGHEKVSTEYKKIADEEIIPERMKYVSDYVDRHHQIYKSNEATLLGEDFAETVRIYTTNSIYLQEKYPRRFAFIAKSFPFIKPDTVVGIIKK